MGEARWHDVTIVWSLVDDVDVVTEADLAEMGASQLARYHDLSGVRATAFLAGRTLLRDLVLRLGGPADFRIDSRCERCGHDHAAPRSAGFALSVSHADDLVVVAASATATAVGVDLETDAAGERVSGLRDLLPGVEAPDLAAWTRVEAAVKADGRGLAIDLDAVRLHPHAGGQDATEWTVDLPGRTQGIRVATLRGPLGHTLSVARA